MPQIPQLTRLDQPAATRPRTNHDAHSHLRRKHPAKPLVRRPVHHPVRHPTHRIPTPPRAKPLIRRTRHERPAASTPLALAHIARHRNPPKTPTQGHIAPVSDRSRNSGGEIVRAGWNSVFCVKKRVAAVRVPLGSQHRARPWRECRRPGDSVFDTTGCEGASRLRVECEPMEAVDSHVSVCFMEAITWCESTFFMLPRRVRVDCESIASRRCRRGRRSSGRCCRRAALRLRRSP